MMKKKQIYFFVLIISTFTSCKSDNIEPAFIDTIFGKYDIYTCNVSYPDGRVDYCYNGQTVIVSKENGALIGVKNVINAVNYPTFSYKEVPNDAKRIRLYKNVNDNKFVGEIWTDLDAAKNNITRIVLQLNYTDTNGTEFKYNAAKFGK